MKLKAFNIDSVLRLYAQDDKNAIDRYTVLRKDFV